MDKSGATKLTDHQQAILRVDKMQKELSVACECNSLAAFNKISELLGGAKDEVKDLCQFN